MLDEWWIANVILINEDRQFANDGGGEGDFEP